MAYCYKNARQRIHPLMRKLETAYSTRIAQLHCTAYVTPEPVPFAERTSGEPKELTVGGRWGNLWDCAWMHFTGEIPADLKLEKDETLILLIDVNGEGLLYDQDGTPIMGLTTGTSAYEYGTCAKRTIPVSLCGAKDGKIDIWVDAGCNDLFGRFVGSGTLEEASIAIRHEQLRSLHYDIHVLADAMEALPESSVRHHSILRALDAAANCLCDFTTEEAVKAREILKKELDKQGGDPSLHIAAIGHAHIDLAWLWPIRETIRKGARTFSHTLRLMERYPDYKFGASQAQLYDWMKQYYPTIYADMKQRIREKRWEVQGAMWVEPDTNVTGGESLIRQILVGTRFWKDEFGVTVNNLWLPDVFGYTGALPQILKKSGIDYFMTQKLSWNEHDSFPHHTFWWEGIDGSRVLTHMLPEETYNGPALPHSVTTMEKNFKEKGLSEYALMLFGIGDGGGGPGAYHLERLDRIQNLEGFSPVKQRFARDLLEDISRENAEFSTWKGELYLENHRGTYTTQAKNKRYNRKLEYALRNLEYLAVLAESRAGIPYPAEELDKIWKEILLYQFHDILPGSSITRVYTESLARYAVLEEQIQQLTNVRLAALTAEKPALYNTLSFERTEMVTHNGETRRITVPAMAAVCWENGQPVAADELTASENLLENECLCAKFDETGALISLFDKKNQREVLAAPANILRLYDDSNGNAWNIEIYYEDKPVQQMQLKSARAYLENGAAVLEQHYVTEKSSLIQKIRLEAGSDLLVFDTEADWHEHLKMLRTSFPVDVYSDEAICDIQFGNLHRSTHRNTSWDVSQFEICAHKWVDLNDGGYGISLLNDCKYGYKAENNILDLNLLRSSNDTSERDSQPLDQGVHHFAYAIYPHSGDEKQAKVEQKALAFNIPLLFAECGTAKHLPEENFVRVAAENVELSAVKRAEDASGVIVRLFEIFGRKSEAEVTLPAGTSRCFLCSLTENEEQELTIREGKVLLPFHPFEIQTLKLQ
ncbi:MAG: alpha-mannosidase [Candidatus Merdivicinus sp.]|jgi:alpha-mannosidase